MERRAADVQAIRVILSSSAHGAQITQSRSAAIWGSEDLVQKSLDLWQKRLGHQGDVRFHLCLGHLRPVLTIVLQIVLSQEPADANEPRGPASRAASDSMEPLQLVSSTKLMPRR